MRITGAALVSVDSALMAMRCGLSTGTALGAGKKRFRGPKGGGEGVAHILFAGGVIGIHFIEAESGKFFCMVAN